MGCLGSDETNVSLCQICENGHDARFPHNRDSLAYRKWFMKHNGRKPSWLDAMAHCSTLTRLVFAESLVKQGVQLEDTGDE